MRTRDSRMEELEVMRLIESLLSTLPDGSVLDVQVGVFWTAVVAETAGRRHCGLASTLQSGNHHHEGPPVRAAGRLLEHTGRELAELIHSPSLLEAAIGMATINALLPEPSPEGRVDLNAEAVIARHGAGRRVAVVGHFPFIPRLQKEVGQLWVLEKEPRGQDLPAEAAADVIPQADVVAITGTSLINHTFEELVSLCRPGALVLMLGPSTPLSPLLFDHGLHLISGSLVENEEAVLRAVRQGAHFRQVHRHGVRLVTMGRPGTL